MKVVTVKPEEAYRIDRILVSIFGEYKYRQQQILIYFNPRVDILNLKSGTRLMVPSESDIRKIHKFRGYYDLMRD